MGGIRAVSKLDEMGGVVRRLIGDLAENPVVYNQFGTVGQEGVERMPYGEMFRGLPNPPPPGTEVGLVSPYELIRRVSYPDDLGYRAARRTDDSPLQRRYEPSMVPLYTRPGDMIGSRMFGRRLSAEDRDTGEIASVLDLAAGAPDALRTLVHEARHATQQPGLSDQRALRSISSYNAPGLDGRSLTDHSRRYLAQPTELFAHLSEVGDDFVKQQGRLLQSDYDARMAMEMLEAGEAMPRLHPLAKQLYVESYKNSKPARQHINNVLTRYFAVPGAVGSAAAAGEGTE